MKIFIIMPDNFLVSKCYNLLQTANFLNCLTFTIRPFATRPMMYSTRLRKKNKETYNADQGLFCN